MPPISDCWTLIMTKGMVISEEQGVELLAFLITSARCHLDDPPDYGSMRLLDAAERLSDFMKGRASPETQQLLALILKESPRVQSTITDRDQYTSLLDELCRDVARYLVEHSAVVADR